MRLGTRHARRYPVTNPNWLGILPCGLGRAMLGDIQSPIPIGWESFHAAWDAPCSAISSHQSQLVGNPSMRLGTRHARRYPVTNPNWLGILPCGLGRAMLG